MGSILPKQVPYYEMALTPVDKGENEKIYGFLFLSHALALQLSGILINDIRDRWELFWPLYCVFGATSPETGPNEIVFTPVYKCEKWKIYNFILSEPRFRPETSRIVFKWY